MRRNFRAYLAVIAFILSGILAQDALAERVGFEFNQNINTIDYTIFNSAAIDGGREPGSAKITQVTIDLTNAYGMIRFGNIESRDLYFDTDGGLGDTFLPFTTFSSSPLNVIYPDPIATDNQKIATLNFSDFDAFESIKFGVAIDAADQPDFEDNVYELIGAAIEVTFDNGQVLTGITEDRGNLIFGTIVLAPIQPVPIPPALLMFFSGLVLLARQLRIT